MSEIDYVQITLGVRSSIEKLKRVQEDLRKLMPDPEFKEVDLKSLMEDGVLMQANEQFFWPLGLALTWHIDEGEVHDLHVRQWVYDDDHHEPIVLDEDDEVAVERRERFAEWIQARIASLPEDERIGALSVLSRSMFKTDGELGVH